MKYTKHFRALSHPATPDVDISYKGYNNNKIFFFFIE